MAHVLVVDDDADIRRLLQLQLDRSGHQTTLASCGAEALEALGRDPRPDVALLDLRMPDMSGAELLDRIRATDGDLPVVIVSGTSKADAGRAAHDPHCAYLMKPFTSAGLLDAIVQLMPYARSA